MDHHRFDALARALARRANRRQGVFAAIGAALGASRLPGSASAKGGGNQSCDGHKVLWCHCPPGNLFNCRTLCIARSGTNGHSGHEHDCSCEDPDCACSASDIAGATCRPASPLNGQCMVAGDCRGGLDCINNRCATPCVPETCASAKAMCGTANDGCGGTLACGNCPRGFHCVLNACVADTCGNVGDPCAAPDECCDGLQCSAGACVVPCTPVTCEARDLECGRLEDGCGNTVNCGRCGNGASCIRGRCVRDCEPKTCSERNIECGAASDGCGGTLWCGACENGQDCEHGICVRKCERATCESLRRECGEVPDGCDGTLNCGSCAQGEICTGEGVCREREQRACATEGDSCEENACCLGLGCIEGICQSQCVPITCDDLGAQCGETSDGCGAPLYCGACPDGEQCLDGICLPVNTLTPTGGECLGASECETGLICTADTCVEPTGGCRGIGQSCENADCCGGQLCGEDAVCVEMTSQCAADGDDCTDHPCCDLSQTCAPTEMGHQCQPTDSRETGGGNEPDQGKNDGGRKKGKNNNGGGKPDNNKGNGKGDGDGDGAVCVHAGGRPKTGERCCDRLHLEKGQCVINRWDHCDQGNQGQASFCERGTTCEGRRISPHHQEVCVPRRHRRRVLAAGL